MNDEMRIIITSEGQDPSDFKFTLPLPLHLDTNWKVALTEIKIPEKIKLIDGDKDYINIYRDKSEAGMKRRPNKYITLLAEKEWTPTNKHPSLLNFLITQRRPKQMVIRERDHSSAPFPRKQKNLFLETITTTPENVPREVTRYRENAGRTYVTIDMSLNSNMFTSPYKIFTTDLEQTLKKVGVSSRYFFDDRTKKGIFTVAHNEWINLVGNLSHIFSLPPLMWPSENHESKYCVDIFQAFRTIYVYSDLAKEVSMGESVYPLLQAFPLNNSTDFGISTSIIFRNPIFLPLQKFHITSISFSLRNELGEKLTFASSCPTTICKLLFKSS